MAKKTKEKIVNVPNFITLWRIPLTLVAIYYLLFTPLRGLAVFLFALSAFTDFLDGQAARGLDQVTKFGAKFDIFADRSFLILFAVSLLIFFWGSTPDLIILVLCLSREIISLPAFVYRRIIKFKLFSEARYIGKIQTVIQAIAVILLAWGLPIALYIALLAFVVGIFAGITYWIDSFE